MADTDDRIQELVARISDVADDHHAARPEEFVAALIYVLRRYEYGAQTNRGVAEKLVEAYELSIERNELSIEEPG